ncbi:MAG TPA: TRAP transporter small permease [Burkholderiaceae bacterium]|nr:TRAP transporter small permease [Burkholderiaceae bacterium]
MTPAQIPVAKATARGIQRLSAGILQAERLALMALMALLTGLILLNVLTRYSGTPLYWVDESAVYAVVWLCFVGASCMTRLRLDFAVTLLTDAVGPQWARGFKAASAACVWLFGLAMLAMCWLWMDPAGILRHGFDARAFAEETFNFLYTERTQTLGWPTWLVQLVIPLFAACFTVHASANLVEDLGWTEPISPEGFHLGTAEETVN